MPEPVLTGAWPAAVAVGRELPPPEDDDPCDRAPLLDADAILKDSNKKRIA